MSDTNESTKQRQQLLLIVGLSILLVAVGFGIWYTDPNRKKENKGKPVPKLEVKYDGGDDLVDSRDVWIAKSEEELAGVDNEIREQERTIKALMDRIESLEKEREESSGYKGNAVEGQEPEETSMKKKISEKALPPAPKRSEGEWKAQSSSSGVPASQGKNGIVMVDLRGDNRSEEDSLKNVDSFIPAGSFMKAVLLTGLDAPTGGQSKTDPMPVALRLLDNAVLPNHFKSQTKSCHAVGQAHGNISSERAEIRVEKLSCVMIDGDVLEVAVTGFVAGEDGKAGFRGEVVSKQGSMIAKSLMAGLFSGAGESLESQYQQTSTSALGSVQSIDPDRVGEAAAARGVGNAFEKIADFYIARANEVYPIIEVDSRRIGEIVLLKGIDLGNVVITNTRQK